MSPWGHPHVRKRAWSSSDVVLVGLCHVLRQPRVAHRAEAGAVVGLTKPGGEGLKASPERPDLPAFFVPDQNRTPLRVNPFHVSFPVPAGVVMPRSA